MNILSIQSAVAFGHVGNSAAVFPLQRLGHEVWPINTVQFSNHTGYGAWRGQVFPASDLAALVEGIAERGALSACDGVLSGYLGDASIGAVILDAVSRVRAANPRALYCCDPVIGDEGRGVFVRPGIAEFFASQALPAADIVTPNRFELALLTGLPVTTAHQAIAAARALMAQGPSLVCVTSLLAPAVGEGQIGSLLVSAAGVWLAHTPLIAFATPPNGTGDLFAALFLGNLLNRAEPAQALERTVSALYALLLTTRDLGRRELALVQAQDLLSNPPPMTILQTM